uniref:Uncharacterized protein n=1 Tax=Panagrolaimus davidi TaxID=227884 RepID=A0A914QWZ0_9BILA
MSNTPMIPNFGTSTSVRKRKLASVEERVPTPYPKTHPKFHKKLFIEHHSTTSPSESKKAKVNIGTNEFEIPHLKKEDSKIASKVETEIEKETKNDKNDRIENLKNEINGIIDRMLNRMITNIENLRKNILFEIDETFGCENTVESFDEEIELQTDDEGGEGTDGKSNKLNAEKIEDNPEGIFADLKTGDKEEESNNEMDSQTDEKEVDPKNSNCLNVNDLSFET